MMTTARHARAQLTIAGSRYDAPVTFCDPSPFAFNLLGQEGFLRFVRVTICAADEWLEVEPEPSSPRAAAGHPPAGAPRATSRA